jgi:hypothetical protein
MYNVFGQLNSRISMNDFLEEEEKRFSPALFVVDD